MTTAREAFIATARDRILIFDGAYGTAIQRYGLTEADYRGDLPLRKGSKGQ